MLLLKVDLHSSMQGGKLLKLNRKVLVKGDPLSLHSVCSAYMPLYI